MKNFFFVLLLPSLLFYHSHTNASITPADHVGFALPDSVTEFTLRYETIENLIILPVQINKDLKLNLILDTGCRNIVLFGRRFNKYFRFEPGKVVKFSGLGDGSPVQGSVALNNTVSIGAVLGERIPLVVVPNRNLFSSFTNIHGVIGYDIFLKFQIEVDPLHQSITFRPVAKAFVPPGFTRIPMTVTDARPMINSTLTLGNSNNLTRTLMVDTGSTLGLLLKSTDIKSLALAGKNEPLGRGFNGYINGIVANSQRLLLETYEILNLPTGIVESEWHNHASVGMDVLKDYAFILNYVMGYACLKKQS